MTAIRIEVPVEGNLVPEINPTTSGVHLSIGRGDSQFADWATTAIRNIRNSRWVVAQIFTHCVNAVVRILPATQQANCKNYLFAKFRSLCTNPCIHAF